MLNRRKLINLILSELHSERVYYDLKEKVDLTAVRGRGQLLRAISGMANSISNCRAFIIVGVEDKTREIVGASIIDDSNIQSLVEEYLIPRPNVLYENVPHPHSASEKIVGLITIHPTTVPCKIRKNIWKLKVDDCFVRNGSVTKRIEHGEDIVTSPYCSESVALENRASVSLRDTIDEIFQFYNMVGNSYNPKYAVFNDQHIICYSGWEDIENGKLLLSEVNISLVTEGVKIFWSALQYVNIYFDDKIFTIEENIMLFWSGKKFFAPYETTVISFNNDATYNIEKSFIFKTPDIPPKEIVDFVKSYKSIEKNEPNRLEILPYELLIATLNGSVAAREELTNFLGGGIDGSVAESYFDAIKILKSVDECKVSVE